MLYIDTSVLLPYTLTQAIEAARYRSTEKFFTRISEGRLSAATSFYALHELYIFALDNTPDFAVGSAFGKAMKDGAAWITRHAEWRPLFCLDAA